ncbi:peptide chain release factor domain protein [Neisseria meningitidis]|nr:peptide chain release factor domain protein [Neisseria meningitidis]
MPSKPEKRASDGIFGLQLKRRRSKSRRIGYRYRMRPVRVNLGLT